MSTSSRRTVLIVDDEVQFLRAAQTALLSEGVEDVVTCADSRLAMEVIGEHPVAVVVLDVMMPHVTGEDLLRCIAETHPEVAVIMATAVDDLKRAVAMMRAGAADYLVKPITSEQLRRAVERALELTQLREDCRIVRECLAAPDEKPACAAAVVTQDPRMCALLHYAVRIAPSDRAVLITGETGVGKELVARLIHEQSGRAGPLVVINVAGTDSGLFADRMFGHTRGAYTGADGSRVGMVEKARDGTLVLDEIGDLDAESQVKLLRLLQNREFYPLGGDTAKLSRARVVATTHRDLAQMVAAGTFRQDLFYRLTSHELRVPALRDRPLDIPLLLDHFVARAAAELGKPRPELPVALARLLQSHDFPGNVRELEGLVFDAVSQHTSGPLAIALFEPRLAPRGARPDPGGPTPTVVFPARLPTLDELEDLAIDEALTRAHGRRQAAAEMLGLSRQALNMRLSRRRRRR